MTQYKLYVNSKLPKYNIVQYEVLNKKYCDYEFKSLDLNNKVSKNKICF
jgi:hypothetical protein